MMPIVRIRTDEAGDFNYDNPNRFWISVVAGVVIPDTRWVAVQEFASERAAERGLAELKAAEMDAVELLEVAQFIVAQDLTVAAIATDSRIFTAEGQRRWRERQVEVFRAAADRSRRAAEDPQTRERVDRLRRRMHQERHIKQANYLQYGILTPWLLAHLISASLLAYRQLSTKEDGWILDIVMDAKGGADPGKAGELLRDSIEAIFASDDRTALRMPSEWSADHPFKVKHNDPEIGAVSGRQVLAGGIKPGSSEEDPGLQLADFAAHVLLTLLRDPDNEAAIAAWRVLASKIMPTEDGWPIKVWAWPEHDLSEDDIRRYVRLVRSPTS